MPQKESCLEFYAGATHDSLRIMLFVEVMLENTRRSFNRDDFD